MVNRYMVEQVFSYFGLVFWSLQLAPQAYKTYRRGTSTGVSVWAMLIWTSAGVFMGVYNIGLGVAIALWIQPQIFTFIACICLFQEFRYQHKWPLKKTCIGFVSSCLFFSGLEIGLVFAFKKAEQVENQGAIHFFGILPVVTILGGFLPQYYEIFRDKRVIGISHLFLAMDFFGSIFSTISLGMSFGATNWYYMYSFSYYNETAFRDEIDALDLANYIAIACFDVGILVLYYIFEWCHKKKGATNNSDDETRDSNEMSHDCNTAPEIKTVPSGEKLDL